MKPRPRRSRSRSRPSWPPRPATCPIWTAPAVPHREMRPEVARDALLVIHGGLSWELCAVLYHISPVALTHRRVSTGARAASGDRQLPTRLRRLLDRIEEVVQVHRGVERRQAALSGPDRRGEQGIHLPDVERIATLEVGRDIHKALRDRQVAERVAATRALQ